MREIAPVSICPTHFGRFGDVEYLSEAGNVSSGGCSSSGRMEGREPR